MLYDPKWAKKKRLTTKSLAAIYRSAADAIDQNGHSIGKLKDSRGRMCVWGAIGLIVEGDPYKATTRTRNMLQPLSDFLGQPVIKWNNTPRRTKRQVVCMMRAAADSLADA